MNRFAVLSALSQLKQPKYGYALAQALADRGLEIEQGTLYPLLRRLEKQGLLSSDWVLEEARPRRYYVLSPMGAEVLKELRQEWYRLSRVMAGLLTDD